MARFFITGSSDGLGLMTAQRLAKAGHEVVLHARNAKRAQDARAGCPEAVAVLEADLSSIEETKRLAQAAAALGPFEAVLHNAGVYEGQQLVKGPSGYPVLFTINVLAPYMLAALMPPPQKRLLVVSSQLHLRGKPNLDGLVHSNYSDSKLQTILLTNYLAKLWAGKSVAVNALSPGWVATKMGGKNAPDRMEDALDTFESAVLGTGATANGLTGEYLEKSAVSPKLPVTDDESLQKSLVAQLEKISGVKLEA